MLYSSWFFNHIVVLFCFVFLSSLSRLLIWIGNKIATKKVIRRKNWYFVYILFLERPKNLETSMTIENSWKSCMQLRRISTFIWNMYLLLVALDSSQARHFGKLGHSWEVVGLNSAWKIPRENFSWRWSREGARRAFYMPEIFKFWFW